MHATCHSWSNASRSSSPIFIRLSRRPSSVAPSRTRVQESLLASCRQLRRVAQLATDLEKEGGATKLMSLSSDELTSLLSGERHLHLRMPL